MRIQPRTSANNPRKARSRFLLFLLIAATFFTGVRFWLNSYQMDVKVVSLPARVAPSAIGTVSSQDAFTDIRKGKDGKDTLITLDPENNIRGTVIRNFLELQQQGIIPKTPLPINPFNAPGYKEQGETIAADSKELPTFSDPVSLGRYAYNCATAGYDSCIFKWKKNASTFQGVARDLVEKGYLFIDAECYFLGEHECHLRFHTTDSCHILRAVQAQQEWKNPDGQSPCAPEWADLLPEELQTLSKCLSILKECLTPDMSDHAKAKALADYLCQKLVYHNLDKDQSVFYKHRGKFVIYALSPLLNPKATHGDAICEGYAKTYGLLMTLCGIPSMEISGKLDYQTSGKPDDKGRYGYHAWNLVHLRGQGWYHVDTTWMDAGQINYKYFMATDQQMEHDTPPRTWPSTRGNTSYPASATTQAH